MYTVGKLDDDNTDILRHCHQHLAHILRLLLLLCKDRHLAELCNALNKVCNILAEFLLDILLGHIGVFNNVMQQSRSH